MRFVQKPRKVLFFPSCSRYFILEHNDYKLQIDLSYLLVSVHFVRKDLRFEILLVTQKNFGEHLELSESLQPHSKAKYKKKMNEGIWLLFKFGHILLWINSCLRTVVKAEFEKFSCAWKKADSTSQEEICSMLHNIPKVCGFGCTSVKIYYSGSDLCMVYCFFQYTVLLTYPQ